MNNFKFCNLYTDRHTYLWHLPFAATKAEPIYQRNLLAHFTYDATRDNKKVKSCKKLPNLTL